MVTTPIYLFNYIMNKKERSAINHQKRNKPSTHHIICKCKKDLFHNLTSAMNEHKRDVYRHEKHHHSQGENLPQETLEYYKFFMQVMSPKAKALYEALLAMSVDEFYNPLFVRT
jgi:hypothetical protein